MYYSYLRGRQYELMALRELLEKELLEGIIPIIEPVILSPTLIKTIEAFINRKKSLILISNPKVGDFLKDMNSNDEKKIKLRDKYNLIFNNPIILKAHILNKKSNEEILMLEEKGINRFDTIAINNRDSLDEYISIFNNGNPLISLIPNEDSFKDEVMGKKIISEDSFIKRKRNVDYIGYEDELFSTNHLYFRKNNYDGFSDYSIVGKDYSESGYSPRAIAIHIVYFDEKEKLRIRHFVSDSNDDIKNPAGKYAEALKKMFQWAETQKGIDTYAMSEFYTQYKTGDYPGLGIAKKLSIMHHLELINKYLNKM